MQMTLALRSPDVLKCAPTGSSRSLEGVQCDAPRARLNSSIDPVLRPPGKLEYSTKIPISDSGLGLDYPRQAGLKTQKKKKFGPRNV